MLQYVEALKMKYFNANMKWLSMNFKLFYKKQ